MNLKSGLKTDMKKGFLVLLIVSVFSIATTIAVWIGYDLIADPGRNKKYEIDVDQFMKNNLSSTDSTKFRRGITPSMIKEISARGEQHEYVYDPHTGDRIGKVRDTIIDVFFSSKLEKSDNTRTLVFATFLKALYCYDLENGKEPHLEQYTIFSSGLLFENHTLIKRVACVGEGEYIYNDSILRRHDADALHSSKTNVQHVLVDYKYYGAFPFLKNENEKFWELLEE